jgi:hypothetical protein
MFLHCGISAKIWYEIARWIGHELILPPSLGHSFSMLVGCGTGKIRKKGLSLIWHAFIWSIWRARNNRIFNDGVIDPEEIFDSIKRILWLWFIERMAMVLVFSMSGAGTRENVSIDDGAVLVFSLCCGVSLCSAFSCYVLLLCCIVLPFGCNCFAIILLLSRLISYCFRCAFSNFLYCVGRVAFHGSWLFLCNCSFISPSTPCAYKFYILIILP